LIGAVLVVIGGVLKLVFKTRKPPLGQIMMICIWLGLTLLVGGYLWKMFGGNV
jgi:hypothetical protein